MNLTTKGRYAVMAMADLALSCEGKPIVLERIAERQEIAPGYLEQIFAKLRKHGLVSAVRGPGGGYVLSREPDAICVAEIISAVEESIKMTRCEKHSAHEGPNGCMHKKARCLTHDLWEGLGQHIEDYLRSMSLKDVVRGQQLMVGLEAKHSSHNTEQYAHLFG